MINLFVLRTLNLVDIPMSTSTHTALMKIRISASLNQLTRVDLVLLLFYHF